MWCTHQGGNQNGFESSEMVGSPQHIRLYMHSPPRDPSESANICELMAAKRALEIAFDKQFQTEINGTCCRVPTGNISRRWPIKSRASVSQSSESESARLNMSASSMDVRVHNFPWPMPHKVAK